MFLTLSFGCPLGTSEAQADLASVGIDAENLDFDLVAGLDNILRLFDLVVCQF